MLKLRYFYYFTIYKTGLTIGLQVYLKVLKNIKKQFQFILYYIVVVINDITCYLRYLVFYDDLSLYIQFCSSIIYLLPNYLFRIQRTTLTTPLLTSRQLIRLCHILPNFLMAQLSYNITTYPL